MPRPQGLTLSAAPDSCRVQVPQEQTAVKMSAPREEGQTELEPVNAISAAARVALGAETCSKCLIKVTADDAKYAIICSGDRCIFHLQCASDHVADSTTLAA